MIDWGKWLPVIIPSAVAGVTGIIGAKNSNNAINNATDAQLKASSDATALLKQINDQARQDNAPWTQAGGAAIQELMKRMGLSVPKPTTATGSPSTQPQTSPLTSSLTFNGSPSGGSTIGNVVSGATTGAGIGSFVPGVGTALGAGAGAAVGAVKGLVGQGRKQADQIVPYQNQLKGEVDRITSELNSRRQSGTLTQQDLQTAQNTVNSLVSGFGQYASQFDRAGQGAVDTINQYYGPNSSMMAGWNQELSTLPQTAQTPVDSTQQTAPTDTSSTTTPDFLQTFDPKNATIDPTPYTHGFSMSDLYKDPSYDFIMSEGTKALKRAQASKGMALSGGALKSLQKYQEGLASTEYGNAYSRFSTDRSTALSQLAQDQNQFANNRDSAFNKFASIAGMGQTSTNQQNTANQNFGNQVADLTTGTGNTIAANNIARSNNTNAALNGISNTLSQSILLRDLYGKAA